MGFEIEIAFGLPRSLCPKPLLIYFWNSKELLLTQKRLEIDEQ